MMGDSDGLEPGVHAEHNALLKLKPIKIKKKLETINLLVVRFSKTSKIQSSKPCNNCIKIMSEIPEKKGYKIQNIYYSDSDGNIVKTNLSNLMNEEQHYSRFYRKCRL
jgi:cytidine deaminase